MLSQARRIVVKVGSSLVTERRPGTGRRKRSATGARQLAALAREGRELLMVSSGASCRRHAAFGLDAAARQELHGVAGRRGGRARWAWSQMYETKLREHGMRSAQVLLTHADLADRERYLNARSTLAHAARSVA